MSTFCDNLLRENINSHPMMKYPASRSLATLYNDLMYFVVFLIITPSPNTLPKLQVRFSKSGKHIYYSQTDHTLHMFNPKCMSSQNAMNFDSSSLH